MTREELKEFLDEKADEFNHPEFIESDPIQIPHRFSRKEDIEIAALLTATLAWGNRKMIIGKTSELMERMGNSPYDFTMNYHSDDYSKIEEFKHRTFNSIDLDFFIRSLQNLYKNHGGLEKSFETRPGEENTFLAIERFRKLFLEVPHAQRSEKHISSPAKGSAAKRLNMFLRWMVRKDNRGVDFGLWEKISPALLLCPLDVHSGNVARYLKILRRKQNDRRAVLELNSTLKEFDSEDPVKYDFALFGLGVFEKFSNINPSKNI